MELNVNGVARRVDAPADEPLLYVLRDWLDLRGTKYGCGEGHCGACTVIVDGMAVRSCQTRASLVAGRRIRTIEDLASADRLHPVQRAFLEEEAFQCGYCTPGMVMAAVALLGERASPTRAEIVKGMQRNICRCGTYPRIVAAVERAARVRGSEQGGRGESNSQGDRGDQGESNSQGDRGDQGELDSQGDRGDQGGLNAPGDRGAQGVDKSTTWTLPDLPDLPVNLHQPSLNSRSPR